MAVDFGFDTTNEFADHIATFLSEEDARYMAHDIAVYIEQQNYWDNREMYPRHLRNHDLAEVTEIVREQETDENGNWLHVA